MTEDLKKRKRPGLGVALSISGAAMVLFFFFSGCSLSTESDVEVVQRVAMEWTDSAIDDVSTLLADQVIDGNPVLQAIASFAIAGQIRDRTEWRLSEPERLEDGRYTLTATLAAPISVRLLIIERSYEITAEFFLTIDAQKSEVVEWHLYPGSFGAEEIVNPS